MVRLLKRLRPDFGEKDAVNYKNWCSNGCTRTVFNKLGARASWVTFKDLIPTLLERFHSTCPFSVSRWALNDPHWSLMYYLIISYLRASGNPFHRITGKWGDGIVTMVTTKSVFVSGLTHVHTSAAGKELTVSWVIQICGDTPIPNRRLWMAHKRGSFLQWPAHVSKR